MEIGRGWENRDSILVAARNDSEPKYAEYKDEQRTRTSKKGKPTWACLALFHSLVHSAQRAKKDKNKEKGEHKIIQTRVQMRKTTRYSKKKTKRKNKVT